MLLKEKISEKLPDLQNRVSTLVKEHGDKASEDEKKAIQDAIEK